MSRFMIPSRKMIAMLVLVAFFARSVTPALAAPQIRLNKWAGTIDFSATGPSPFTLAGTSSHLGQFTAYGEVDIVPGENVAEGVVVFEAANGDLLVGVTMWEIDANDNAQLHFSWRDSVQFSDGRVVFSTGHFAEAKNRPSGLVVIAIIAILIGLLLPAYTVDY
jgi:hypothetical protein